MLPRHTNSTEMGEVVVVVVVVVEVVVDSTVSAWSAIFAWNEPY